jgi:soluble lytic murein transglycosylase
MGRRRTGRSPRARILAAALALALLAALPAEARRRAKATPSPRARFKQAVAFHDQGQWRRSLVLLDGLRDYPALRDLIDIYRLRALFAGKEYARLAVVAADVVPRMRGGHLRHEGAMLQAQAEMKLGRPGAAYKLYADLWGKFPDRDPARVLYRLGQAAEASGDLAAADVAWSEAAWFHPGSPFAGDAERDLARSRAARGLPPLEPTADESVRAILAAERAKLPLTVAARCERFALRFPDDPRAARVRLTRLEALATRGQCDAVRADAPGLDGASADDRAHAAVLAARCAGADPATVRLALLAVAERFPGSPWAARALVLAADSFWAEKQTLTAAEAYARAVALVPGADDAATSAWRAGFGKYLAGDRARAAALLRWAAARSADSDDAARARYWAGRALQERGDAGGARSLYEEVLARHPLGYHAYWAEARLAEIDGRAVFSGRGPDNVRARLARLETRPTSSLPEDLSPERALTTLAAGNDAAGPRIAELRAIGLTDLAAREVRELVDAAKGDPAALQAAAILDMDLGRRLEAVRIAGRLHDRFCAGEFADPGATLVPLRMPLDYWSLLAARGTAYGIDPFFAAALVRQESVFHPRTTSPASARGLMQILPATGRSIARELGVRRFNPADLYTPAVSVRFGLHYLGGIRDRFGGDLVAALAGYNAGPGRPRRWWPEFAGRPYDEAIERIPIRETRDYVKHILRNYEVYRHWYAGMPGAPTPGESIFARLARETVRAPDQGPSPSPER